MGALTLVASAWIVGRTLGGSTLRNAGWPYQTTAGLIAIAVLILVAGSVALSLAFALVCLLAAVLALVQVILWRRTSPCLSTFAFPNGIVERTALSITATALTLGLVQALAPSTSWDAAVAHLALPSDFVREGRITILPGNAYSGYPLLIHCLFTFAYYAGGELSVQLTAWLMAALACAFTYDLGSQLAGRRAGWIATSILATAPLFAEQAGVASLDVAVAGIVAGALAQWLRWFESSDRGSLLLSGFLAGSACGVRHTGYLVCMLLVCATALHGIRPRNGARGGMLTLQFAAMAVLAAAPWLIRSAYAADNPFYPFFMNMFQSDRVFDTEITALGAHESIKGSGLVYFVTFPWNVVMHPERFDGWGKSPGGLVVILGVPGLFLGGSKARWLGLFSMAGVIAFYHFQHLARYMLPFFLPMMAVATIPCVTSRWSRVALPVWGMGAAMGIVVFIAMVHFKVPAALGIESREDYLTRRVERYPVFAYINAKLPKDVGILTLDPRTYYIDRATFHNYDALKVMRDWPSDRQLIWCKEQKLRYLVYPEAYLKESPGFGEKGYLEQFDRWRHDAAHFTLVKRFELARPQGEAKEVVELYAIQVD